MLGGLLHSSVLAHPLATVLCAAGGLAAGYLPPLAPLRKRAATALFDSSPRAYRIGLFLAGFAFFALTTRLLFSDLPRLNDGIAALFQAKIFARGLITLPLPPEPGFFESFGILHVTDGEGHRSGMYPPGWPALLTAGIFLGIPWLVNPLLGGALALAVSALGEEIYGRRAGRIAGLLTLLSPFVAVLSSTHLSHTATALFGALSFWAVLRLLRLGTVRWGFLAGLFWGIAFLCRPLTALVVGAVAGAGVLVQWRRALCAWRALALGLALTVLSGIVLAAFQNEITGDPLVPGHRIGLGARGKIGFGKLDRARTHTPALGVRHTLMRLRALNLRLTGWPLGGLLFVVLPLLAGRPRFRDWWLIAAPAALAATYAFFWYYETYFPARYLFASVPMMLVLAGRGLDRLPALAGRFFHRESRLPWAIAAGFVLFTLTVSNRDYFGEHGPNFGDMESVLPKVVEAYGIHHAVVFMDTLGECTIRNVPNNDFYGTGFFRNRLDLDGDVVYARNSREENPRILPLYPDRDYYLYRYLRCEGRALLYRLFPRQDRFDPLPVKPLIPEVRAAPPMENIPGES